jgi:hypothetical protein
LVLFKQGDTPASRQQLVGIAGSLATLKPEASNWQALVTATGAAIGNQHITFNAVAPLVIRELKQAAPAAPAATIAATQITIPVDARGAAQAILQSFNRQQVTELVVLLHRVISNSKQN